MAAGEAGAWLVTTPRLSGGLFGAGDLFAALLLGNFMLDRDITAALRLATASTYGILAATVAARSDVLELIPAQNEIVAPSQIFEVVQVA